MTEEERAELRQLLEEIAVDGTGVALRELRPREDDYARVFAPAARERARERYEHLWTGPIDFRHPEPGARVEIEFRPAEGETLMAGRIWVAWRYVVPGRTAGLSYDGLVWCDDHWAWFPKPNRL